jgi:hypothetical protein
VWFFTAPLFFAKQNDIAALRQKGGGFCGEAARKKEKKNNEYGLWAVGFPPLFVPVFRFFLFFAHFWIGFCFFGSFLPCSS